MCDCFFFCFCIAFLMYFCVCLCVCVEAATPFCVCLQNISVIAFFKLWNQSKMSISHASPKMAITSGDNVRANFRGSRHRHRHRRRHRCRLRLRRRRRRRRLNGNPNIQFYIVLSFFCPFYRSFWYRVTICHSCPFAAAMSPSF